MKTKRTVMLSLCVALAMILSYIESQIPSFIPIPGIKMGLANLAVVFVLYKLGFKEAAGVSLVRVLMMGMLFGSGISLIYAMSGACLALTGMGLLKKSDCFSQTGVSVAGGVLHNIGQVVIAAILLKTAAVKVYLPYLLVGGVISGTIIGLISSVLIQRIDNKK